MSNKMFDKTKRSKSSRKTNKIRKSFSKKFTKLASKINKTTCKSRKLTKKVIHSKLKTFPKKIMTKKFCFPLITILIIAVILIVALIYGAESKISADSFSCRDDKGVGIDWVLSYKLPKLEEHPNNIIKNGFGSLFVNSKNADSWTVSGESMNSSRSLTGITLSQIFNAKIDLLIAYNDQPPNGGKFRFPFLDL